jgi:peptide-methionine (S)-S-oxide reductase
VPELRVGCASAASNHRGTFFRSRHLIAMAKEQTAIFGGGCFWCTEAIFQRLTGVTHVESGYMGGRPDQATYRQVCNGDTGHVEVVRVSFDPDEISYRDLVDVFFAVHDPTTLNRQGNDAGEQYRSVIFYNNEDEQKIAEETIAELTAEKAFPEPIVTAVEPAEEFYAAEGYHQNYYNENSRQPYCMFVISPKLAKLEKKFAEKLKAS